jgi:hypothetical protein
MVKDGAVNTGLLTEAAQRIPVALDLKSVEMPVDHNNISSTPAMIEAKLINHERISTGVMLTQELRMEPATNVLVFHRYYTHTIMLSDIRASDKRSAVIQLRGGIHALTVVLLLV